MHSSITKAVLFSSVFLFTGCSSLESAWNSMIGDDSPKPAATAPQTQSESPKAKSPKAEMAESQNAIKQAENLPRFEYILLDTQYTAFLNPQPELIKVNKGSETTTFAYKNGALTLVEHQQQRYRAEDKNIPPSLVQEGVKLQKILGLNSADKNAENIKTGSDAKLNYLCITKLQQVAQTQRVFRSSANMAKSDSRLIADVRLNGNQFYKMDCQLSGNCVAKLSLSKK